mmetsp:Transcript_70339/g.228642  ORF Transcript_70339/g.228642 Transcript_70339/m.228642 type:complete len:140 (+) Transcript_70339:2161-2580(+)
MTDLSKMLSGAMVSPLLPAAAEAGAGAAEEELELELKLEPVATSRRSLAKAPCAVSAAEDEATSPVHAAEDEATSPVHARLAAGAGALHAILFNPCAGSARTTAAGFGCGGTNAAGSRIDGGRAAGGGRTAASPGRAKR